MNGKLLSLLIITIAFLPLLVGAQTGDDATTPFQFLVGIPGIEGDPTQGGFGDYVNALYMAAIGIAGLLAVIKLIVAGTKYMLSDIVTDKQSAKNDIKWSLVGLLVVLGAVVILTTINTDLTDVEVSLTQLDGDTRNYLEDSLNSIVALEEEEYCDSVSNCKVQKCAFDCEAWCNNIPGSRFIAGSLLGYTVGATNYRDLCLYDPANDTPENQIAGDLERIGNPDISAIINENPTVTSDVRMALSRAAGLSRRDDLEDSMILFSAEFSAEFNNEDFEGNRELYHQAVRMECIKRSGRLLRTYNFTIGFNLYCLDL